MLYTHLKFQSTILYYLRLYIMYGIQYVQYYVCISIRLLEMFSWYFSWCVITCSKRKTNQNDLVKASLKLRAIPCPQYPI